MVLSRHRKAADPFCAYNDAYSSPPPPIENRVAVAVEAGELDFVATGYRGRQGMSGPP